MFDLSPIKIIVVVAVTLVLLGPDKVPEVAQRLGAMFRTLRSFQAKVEMELREVIPQLPNSGDLSRMVRDPIGLLSQLADRASSGGVDENDTSFVDENGLESVTAPDTVLMGDIDPVTPPLKPHDPSLN